MGLESVLEWMCVRRRKRMATEGDREQSTMRKTSESESERERLAVLLTKLYIYVNIKINT